MQNVLHWHIVDTQSFPLEIPSYPKLWDGAYSIPERYTIADAAEIVRQDSESCLVRIKLVLPATCLNFRNHICSYAQMRGINVLSELDVPGHAASW